MKTNRRKTLIFLVAFCVLATLITCAYAFRQNHSQTYTDQDYSFRIDLPVDQFSIRKVVDNGVAEIEFVDKAIQDQYPEWGGKVFTILVYDKNAVSNNPCDSLDGPKYLGENDRYYYGVRMPTDVNYPPSEPDVVEHYEELSSFVQNHAINSFTLVR